MNRPEPVDLRFARPLDAQALADEPPFRLGSLKIDPARLQAVHNGTVHAVEPRVMQVLVVLAGADGGVVSRDELVGRCWDGRIVGDNAIQRVVSRLRALGRDTDAYQIEAVSKVGYQLRAATTAPEPATIAVALPVAPAATVPPAVSRRHLLWAVAGTVAAGAAAVVWRMQPGADPDAALARKLVAKAYEAELAGERQSNSQAIAYLTRATLLDPESAVAWGDLALAYQRRMEQSMDQDVPALAEWARSAAARALAIDPALASARIAVATIPPNFRRWAVNERAFRALQQSVAPHMALESALGSLLCDTGRWQDAIGCFRRVLAFEPFHPLNQLALSLALWGGGKLDEVDQMQRNAVNLWPNHRQIWQSRFEFLALTGRPDQAIALVEQESLRPVVGPDETPPAYAALRDFVLALQSGDAAARERAGSQLANERFALGSYPVATYLCALGLIDAAFDMLETRFFGRGGVSAPGPLCRRKTSILFSAKGAPLRADPRYADLLRRTGLHAYWRETGSRPDPWLVSAARL